MKASRRTRWPAARAVVAQAYPFVVEWVASLQHEAAVWKTLERLMRHLAGCSLATVAPDDLLEYRSILVKEASARGIDPAGFAAKEMIVVKRLFKLAHESGVIPSNPGATLIARPVCRSVVTRRQAALEKPPYRSFLWADPVFCERFDDALTNFRGR